MAKKSSNKNRKTKSSNAYKDNVVHKFFDDEPKKASGWHPLDDEIDGQRDKKFVKNIKPRSEGQEILMKAIQDYSLTMAIGPAGTGKTYLAITSAVEALEKGEVERIILSRPAMEAGESLGYLPGDMHEKMAPYLRPLYDALGDRMGGKKVRHLIEDGTIEIAPVGFMRGRTLNNAYVVIDEAQNCTYGQLKMLMSRLGWNSTMVVTGDPDQTDLLDELSGLAQIAGRIEALKNVAVVRLGQKDIVRHPLVAELLDVL